MEDASKLDSSADDEITACIDKYITCELPSEDNPLYEFVSSKQMHTLSVTCRKKGTSCRFHYQKPSSEETLLSKPADDDDPNAAAMPQLFIYKDTSEGQ